MWKGHWWITNKYHESLIHHCRAESNKVHINSFKCNFFQPQSVFFISLLPKLLSIFTGLKFRDNKKYKSFIATCLFLLFCFVFSLKLIYISSFSPGSESKFIFKCPFWFVWMNIPSHKPPNPGLLLPPSALAKFTIISRITILPWNTLHA